MEIENLENKLCTEIVFVTETICYKIRSFLPRLISYPEVRSLKHQSTEQKVLRELFPVFVKRVRRIILFLPFVTTIETGRRLK